MMLFFCTAFLFISCSDSQEDEVLENDLESINVARFTYQAVGVMNNGKFRMTADRSDLLKAFKLNEGKDLAPESIIFLEDNGKMFLRVYSSDNIVSTVQISLNPDTGFVQTEGTICESSACATGGGCLPDGDYCTECKPLPNSEVKGDCKRTTSSGPIQPDNPSSTPA